MRNYGATVAYDGTAYHGFQIQVDLPTIQGELERALQRITQQFVRIHGAGRTDAGVHANGQVISFESNWRHPTADLERALNAVLPADIAVRDLRPAPERFHARYSARSRAYLYTIYRASIRSPLLDRFAHHHWGAFDLAAMARATEVLVGAQDFAAFGQPPQGENTVRRVYRAAWGPVEATLPPAAVIDQYRFNIEANGFLRGMVRRIVGTLLMVASGRLTPAEFGEILASRDISRAGVPAPACGLCLVRVCYPPEALPER